MPTPFPGMLVLAVPPAEAVRTDLAPGEAGRIVDSLTRKRNGEAAALAGERVRLAKIGNRALLAAACNELLLRAGAPSRERLA